MSRTIVVITLVLLLALTFGGRIVSDMITDYVNKRLDSGEAILAYAVDARLYEDFHRPTQPQEIEISPDGLKYRSYDNVVRIYNLIQTQELGGEKQVDPLKSKIVMEIEYADGTKWDGTFNGSIEVKEVDVLNINNKYKVNLANTTSRVIAITYKVHQDHQKNRVSMNRDFTRYLIISR